MRLRCHWRLSEELSRAARAEADLFDLCFNDTLAGQHRACEPRGIYALRYVCDADTVHAPAVPSARTCSLSTESEGMSSTALYARRVHTTTQLKGSRCVLDRWN